ncbi:hypothetical protein BJ165DRAFT_1404114 [Panaeolus papilionaceus]|nr:hypothetical protein BJ165DRAFT_1404114 [Panaeolus papilionaceus]
MPPYPHYDFKRMNPPHCNLGLVGPISSHPASLGPSASSASHDTSLASYLLAIVLRLACPADYTDSNVKLLNNAMQRIMDIMNHDQRQARFPRLPRGLRTRPLIVIHHDAIPTPKLALNLTRTVALLIKSITNQVIDSHHHSMHCCTGVVSARRRLLRHAWIVLFAYLMWRTLFHARFTPSEPCMTVGGDHNGRKEVARLIKLELGVRGSQVKSCTRVPTIDAQLSFKPKG